MPKLTLLLNWQNLLSLVTVLSCLSLMPLVYHAESLSFRVVLTLSIIVTVIVAMKEFTFFKKQE